MTNITFIPSLKGITYKRCFNLLVLYLFPIIVRHGYNYVGFDLSFFKMLHFLVIPLLLLYVGDVIIKRSASPVFKIMRLLLFMILLSIISAWVFWGQPISLGYRATASFLSVIFYFFLKKANFSKKDMEIFFMFFGILWIILWLYAFSKAPTYVFAIDTDQEMESRGIYRLHIPGAFFLYALFFMSINKYINTKRMLFIFVAIILFIFIILQLSRQIIIFSLLVALFYLFRKVKFVWVYMIVIYLGLQFANLKLSDNIIFNSLLNLTERQYVDSDNGTEYIRLKATKYFFTEYTKNPIAIIVGNGVPHSSSSYGKYNDSLKDKYAYFYNDTGYAEVYIFLGIIGLFLVLNLIYKTCRHEVSNKKYLWLQMFIVLIALLNIMSGAFLSVFIELSGILYLYEKAEYKNLEIKYSDALKRLS